MEVKGRREEKEVRKGSEGREGEWRSARLERFPSSPSIHFPLSLPSPSSMTSQKKRKGREWKIMEEKES